MQLQAVFWYQQGRFQEATSEALRAAVVFEKLGVTDEVEGCIIILGSIEMEASYTR